MPDGSPNVTQVTILSNPSHLERLRRIVGCLGDSYGLSAREVHDATLAITEACANAIRHGSPQGPSDRVTIRISSEPGSMVTEVIDQGAGFDPSSLDVPRMCPVPDIGPRLSALPGGLGIPLIKALSDDVQFEHDATGMLVRLTKRAGNR